MKYALYKIVLAKITKISYYFFVSWPVHLHLHETAIFRKPREWVVPNEKNLSNIGKLLFIYKKYLIVTFCARMKISKSYDDFEVLE